MPKFKENPRHNVVSMRISDKEKAELKEVKSRTRKSTSNIMREALELYTFQLGHVRK
jgi:hypothetical protein